jgi:hypothetical protein
MWILLVSIRPQGKSRIAIPLPIFLVWPFAIVAIALTQIVLLCRSRPTRPPLFYVLTLLPHLGGTTVEVRSRGGAHVDLRFI